MRGFCLRVLGALALAACTEDGIYIEVKVPAGMAVTEVDLYLATAECQDGDGYDCTAIVGPRFTSEPRQAVPGQVFYVDSDEPFTSSVDGDTAWFFLSPNSERFVKTAVAVGRDGETNLGVAILAPIDPRESPKKRVRVELRFAIDDVVRGQTPAVEVWRPQDDRYRCVGADSDGRVVYIVPREDPDCDEVVDTQQQSECDPGEHLAVEAKDALSCTTPRALDEVCVLGDRPCDETRPDVVGSCQPSGFAVCLPDLACACSANDAACVASLFEDPDGLGTTHISCVIETIVDGAERITCPDLAVAGQQFGGGGECATPELAIAGDQIGGFAPSVIASTPIGDVTLTPTVDPDCRIGLVAPNARFTQGVPLEPIRALLKVDVTPNSPETRFMVVPMTVAFTDGNCGAETGCFVRLAGGEHVQKCFLE